MCWPLGGFFVNQVPPAGISGHGPTTVRKCEGCWLQGSGGSRRLPSSTSGSCDGIWHFKNSVARFGAAEHNSPPLKSAHWGSYDRLIRGISAFSGKSLKISPGTAMLEKALLPHFPWAVLFPTPVQMNNQIIICERNVICKYQTHGRG